MRHHEAMRTAVIVAGCESYRTGDFLTAASLLRLRPVVATDASAPLDGASGHLEIDLEDPEAAAAQILEAAPNADAVVAVDDQGVYIATLAARLLGLPHNPVDAVVATRDKLAMRRLLAAAEIPQPRFAAVGPGELAEVAGRLGYPVVAKPVGLSASRGVIRVDGPIDAPRVERRIRKILSDAGRDPAEPLLVERYVPGVEVVVEGLVVNGEVDVLAVIDKPVPLDGPFFEETMFVTPSRHSTQVQTAAVALAGDAVRALGLEVGPIHAEIRVPPNGPQQLIEVAARSIGGLCGRSLSFGLLGESLESVVLRSALGIRSRDMAPARPASGVVMLPIPASGTLTGVENLDAVRAIAGVDDISITVANGRPVRALPEGDRYLGFVFASGTGPGEVEVTLREAAATVVVTIDGEEVESQGMPAAT